MIPDSTVNHVLTHRPAPGNRIRAMRLDGTDTLELTELHDRSGRLAVRLAELGVGEGDRIGVLAANRLEWVLLDLAALRLKAVVAGLDPESFEPSDVVRKRYDLKMIFTDRSAHGDGIHSLARVWELSEPGPGPQAPPAVTFGPADPVALKFTSGSTGEPKALTASAGSVDASLRGVQDMFAHGPGDDIFIFLPLALLQQRYWIYSALRYGHDVTMSTYEASFEALRRAEPTVVMGVPGFYESTQKRVEMMARRTGETRDVRAIAREVFGPRVRYLWTGSAPARGTMLEFFFAAGLPIYEGYGLNETCIVTKNHPGAHRAGSVGRVLPGKQVLFDELGVISVRSEYPVGTRYDHAAPGESEKVFRGDVVRTNDTGHLDEDGFLFITGRADDAIVLENGRKILVRPIEETMKDTPAIVECVVFHTRNNLVAVVSPTADPADGDAIRSQLLHANSILSAGERIAKVVVAEPAFSVENGLLTSQSKPRRSRIFDVFRAKIHDSEEGFHASRD